MGGTGGTAPMPDPKNIDKNADDLKKDIEKENANGGAAKPDERTDPKERTDPGQAKPQPMGGAGNDAQPKPEPNQPDPMNPMPMGKNNAAPSASKPAGNLEKPG